MRQPHLASGGNGIRSGLGLSLCQAPGADPQDSLPAAVCLDMYHRTTARTFHPDLWEKYGVDQALNAGLAPSPRARILLIQLTGASLPLGMHHPDARNPG